MLNSISSFFFGSSTPEEATTVAETTTTTTSTPGGVGMPTEGAGCRLKETPAEEEWILIDKSSREVSPARRSVATSSSSSPDVTHLAVQRVPPTAVTPPGESSDSDIGSDISTLPDNACSGETWLVTPPPCFTAGGNSPQRMEQSPLENLLIEHPSMSVYGPRLRQNSAGIESDLSESSEGAADTTRSVGRRHLPRAAAVRSSPRQPRAVAARAGLSSIQQTVKAADVATRRSKKRQLSGKQLARNNLTHRATGAKRQRNKSLVMQPAPRGAAGKRC